MKDEEQLDEIAEKMVKLMAYEFLSKGIPVRYMIPLMDKASKAIRNTIAQTEKEMAEKRMKDLIGEVTYGKDNKSSER